MYAEIKSNNKVLINRLDDSERILLKQIADLAKDTTKKVEITELTDENGDFGGIFLEVNDIIINDAENSATSTPEE